MRSLIFVHCWRWSHSSFLRLYLFRYAVFDRKDDLAVQRISLMSHPIFKNCHISSWKVFSSSRWMSIFVRILFLAYDISEVLYHFFGPYFWTTFFGQVWPLFLTTYFWNKTSGTKYFKTHSSQDILRFDQDILTRMF